MEMFHEGSFNEGCSLLHDFFDNNIYLFFENPRQSNFQQSDQRKEEYKVAIGHSTLQKVSVSIKCFLFEIAAKLLEETLRWAQLNHHETEVQYCLLYKGKIMEKLGDSRLHFTYTQDSLAKALSFNNYALQVHACLQHVGMELYYDLNKLKKELGQNRNLNPGFIINTAFVRLLSEIKYRQAQALGQYDIYSLRKLVLSQRKDYLHQIGYRKNNLFHSAGTNQLVLVNPNEASGLYMDFLHLESLLDEDVVNFFDKWQQYILDNKTHIRDFLLTFFDAYFQARVLIRRRDLETVPTYFGIMEKIIGMLPEAMLLFKFWSIKIDLLIEQGCYDQANRAAGFLIREMEKEGYSKGRIL